MFTSFLILVFYRRQCILCFQRIVARHTADFGRGSLVSRRIARISLVQRSICRRRGREYIVACRSRSRYGALFQWAGGKRDRGTQRGCRYDRKDKSGNPALYMRRNGGRAACSLPCYPSCLVPHSPQKRVPKVIGAPHLRHFKAPSFAPHS